MSVQAQHGRRLGAAARGVEPVVGAVYEHPVESARPAGAVRGARAVSGGAAWAITARPRAQEKSVPVKDDERAMFLGFLAM